MPAANRFALPAILLAGGLLFFVQLAGRSSVSEEFRWVQIAKEIESSGDYFRPTIHGKVYYDKPIGSYWLIVAAGAIRGGVDEVAARWPAALSGVIGLWLVISLGSRLYDRRTGLVSGFILATSYGYTFYSRRATADLETVTGVLAAIWLFDRHRHQQRGNWVFGFWLVLATTSLTKGLLGFALPLVILGSYGMLNRLDGSSTKWGKWRILEAVIDGNRWFFQMRTLLAVPMAVILYLAPFIISAANSGSMIGLEMVVRENLQRFVAPHNHTGPVWLYVQVLPLLIAPWTLLLPAALIPASGNTQRGSDDRSADRFARVYFWATFAFFTLSASRRNYYLLPIVPAAAMLIARTLTASPDILRPSAKLARTIGMIGSILALLLAGIALVPPAWILPSPYHLLPPLPCRGLFAIGWFACITAVGYALIRRSPPLLLATGLTTAYLGIGYLFAIAYPALEELRTRQPFAAAVHEQTDIEGGLWLYRSQDFLLALNPDGPVAEAVTLDELHAQIQRGKVRWLVLRERHLAELQCAYEFVEREKSQPWEAEDQQRDKLRLIRILESKRIDS